MISTWEIAGYRSSDEDPRLTEYVPVIMLLNILAQDSFCHYKLI